MVSDFSKTHNLFKKKTNTTQMQRRPVYVNWTLRRQWLELCCGMAAGRVAPNRRQLLRDGAVVVAALSDPLCRIAVTGGRLGMPLSLGSVYAGSVTRFLGGDPYNKAQRACVWLCSEGRASLRPTCPICKFASAHHNPSVPHCVAVSPDGATLALVSAEPRGIGMIPVWRLSVFDVAFGVELRHDCFPSEARPCVAVAPDASIFVAVASGVRVWERRPHSRRFAPCTRLLTSQWLEWLAERTDSMAATHDRVVASSCGRVLVCDHHGTLLETLCPQIAAFGDGGWELLRNNLNWHVVRRGNTVHALALTATQLYVVDLADSPLVIAQRAMPITGILVWATYSVHDELLVAVRDVVDCGVRVVAFSADGVTRTSASVLKAATSLALTPAGELFVVTFESGVSHAHLYE